MKEVTIGQQFEIPVACKLGYKQYYTTSFELFQTNYT